MKFEKNYLGCDSNRLLGALIFMFALTSLMSCKKILQIDQPVSVITTGQVYSNDENAEAAMAGIYSSMINANVENGVGFGNGFISVYCGTSADEFTFVANNAANFQFADNQLQSSNPVLDAALWENPYFLIYGANSMISGLANSTGVHDSIVNELTGEAEVVRAFCNFYLVNLFGNIPLVTTTNFSKIDLLMEATPAEVYQLIISDLKDAQRRLPNDYSAGQGQRIVPNRYAAAALLARVYLYMGDWADAYGETNSVIGNGGLYSLVGLDSVFLMNSTEAIWQLQVNPQAGWRYNVTPEAFLLIPRNAISSPFVNVTPQLLGAFDSGDQRRTEWIDSTTYRGNKYHFPYKYKAGPAQEQTNGPVSEYYMVLRLGEQLLIRAEAQAHGAGGGLTGAITDLNSIRQRAGLLAYYGPTDSTDVLDSIYHERQVELFAEWGHRWLDLKRTGMASDILSIIPTKQPWSNNALLYPIPYSELVTDPNLAQNRGY